MKSKRFALVLPRQQQERWAALAETDPDVAALPEGRRLSGWIRLCANRAAAGNVDQDTLSGETRHPGNGGTEGGLDGRVGLFCSDDERAAWERAAGPASLSAFVRAACETRASALARRRGPRA